MCQRQLGLLSAYILFRLLLFMSVQEGGLQTLTRALPPIAQQHRRLSTRQQAYKAADQSAQPTAPAARPAKVHPNAAARPFVPSSHDQENMSPHQQLRSPALTGGRGNPARVFGDGDNSHAAGAHSGPNPTKGADKIAARVSDSGSCRSRISKGRAGENLRRSSVSQDGSPMPAYMQSTASVRAKEFCAKRMLRDRKSLLQQQPKTWA